MTDRTRIAKDSALHKAVCLYCPYHLYCKYRDRASGHSMFVCRDFFDPEGIIFRCSVKLPNPARLERIHVDMKWRDIERAGKDAYDEVQNAIRF